jgi:hypothetical protein
MAYFVACNDGAGKTIHDGPAFPNTGPGSMGLQPSKSPGCATIGGHLGINTVESYRNGFMFHDKPRNHPQANPLPL